jgi:hypothetical protein
MASDEFDLPLKSVEFAVLVLVCGAIYLLAEAIVSAIEPPSAFTLSAGVLIGYAFLLLAEWFEERHQRRQDEMWAIEEVDDGE